MANWKMAAIGNGAGKWLNGQMAKWPNGQMEMGNG
jgi:hypothetical protein